MLHMAWGQSASGPVTVFQSMGVDEFDTPAFEHSAAGGQKDYSLSQCSVQLSILEEAELLEASHITVLIQCVRQRFTGGALAFLHWGKHGETGNNPIITLLLLLSPYCCKSNCNETVHYNSACLAKVAEVSVATGKRISVVNLLLWKIRVHKIFTITCNSAVEQREEVNTVCKKAAAWLLDPNLGLQWNLCLESVLILFLNLCKEKN